LLYSHGIKNNLVLFKLWNIKKTLLASDGRITSFITTLEACQCSLSGDAVWISVGPSIDLWWAFLFYIFFYQNIMLFIFLFFYSVWFLFFIDIFFYLVLIYIFLILSLIIWFNFFYIKSVYYSFFLLLNDFFNSIHCIWF